MFIVCANSGSGIAGAITIGNTVNTISVKFPLPNQGTPKTDRLFYGGANRITLGPTDSDNKVYSSLSTPTSISAWKNLDSLGSPVLVSSTATGSSINVGSFFPEIFSGTIQEVRFYDGNASSRTDITEEMMQYYRIPPYDV